MYLLSPYANNKIIFIGGIIMNNNIFSTKDIFEYALEYISTTHDCNRFDIKTTDVGYIEKLITDVDTLRVQYGVEGYIYHGTNGRGLIHGDSRTAKYTKVCDKNGKPLWRYEGWCDKNGNGEYNINLSLFDEQYHLEVVVETTTAKYTMHFDRVSCDNQSSIDDVIDDLNQVIAYLDYDDDDGYSRLTKEVVALSEATTLKQLLSIITPEEKDGGWFNDISKTIGSNSINEIIVNMYGTPIRLHVDRDGCIIYPILSVFSDGQLSPIYIEYEDGTYSASREEETVNA